MGEIAAIIEMDVERDRKECLKLDQKVTGANRELAQWLLDHPRYFAPVVAEWLSCGQTRIKELRRWAQGGFKGGPSDPRRNRADRRRAADAPLKSLDNSAQDEMPSEEEADESWQNDLYEQACLLLEQMADATRKRLFAYIRGNYREN